MAVSRRGGGGGHRPLQIVASPLNLAVLLTHCGQLILRKISKFDAIKCQILRLKCTKFYFRRGSAPDPTRGACSAPPEPLYLYKWPTSKAGWGRGKGGEEGGEGKTKGKGQPPKYFVLERPMRFGRIRPQRERRCFLTDR